MRASASRDLALLRRELRLVGEVLEAAAAAGRVVRARRLDARGAGLERPRVASASAWFRFTFVTRARTRSPGKAAADEDDEAVQARDAVPAVGERVDRELELLVLLETGRPRPDGIGGSSGRVGMCSSASSATGTPRTKPTRCSTPASATQVPRASRISTDAVPSADELEERFAGIWLAPASPYRSMDGRPRHGHGRA